MQIVTVAKDYRILIPASIRSIVPLKELAVKVEKRSAIKFPFSATL